MDGKTLAELRVGERGVLGRGPGGSGQSVALRRRLFELGFLPGTDVQVLRGGDPMVVRLRGFSVTIPRSHAARLPVERSS